MQFLGRLLILALIAFAGLTLRNAPLPGVLHKWGESYADGDCYARMTRVERVVAQPGLILRSHDFENFPLGTRPHATAPLDYVLAAPDLLVQRRGLSHIMALFLGPVCFAGILLLLTAWIARLDWPAGWWAGPALFALSPAAVHGTVVARPDHQALLLLLLAAAAVADGWMLRQKSRTAAALGGLAWGFALWTSLYEPAVLFALTRCAFGWKDWRLTARSAIVTGFVLLLALWLEGWRIELGWLRGEQAADFARWSARIGELASQPPWSPTMFGWLGGFLLLAPFVLWRGPRWLGGILLVLLALTCWQARWGCFLVLATAVALPLVSPRKTWWRQALLVVAMLPVFGAALQYWQAPRQPSFATALHQHAMEIRWDAQTQPSNRHGILAPWWLCAPLSYWSQFPAIAGSSHQSIAGAIDAEKFLASTDDAEAFNIVRRRRIRWIVVEAEKQLLEGAMEPSRYKPDSLAMRARHAPEQLPDFLERPPRWPGSIYESPFLLLRVRAEYLAP